MVVDNLPDELDNGITVNAVARASSSRDDHGRAVRDARGRPRLTTMSQGGLPVDVAETIAWFAAPARARSTETSCACAPDDAGRLMTGTARKDPPGEPGGLATLCGRRCPRPRREPAARRPQGPARRRSAASPSPASPSSSSARASSVRRRVRLPAQGRRTPHVPAPAGVPAAHGDHQRPCVPLSRDRDRARREHHHRPPARSASARRSTSTTSVGAPRPHAGDIPAHFVTTVRSEGDGVEVDVDVPPPRPTGQRGAGGRASATPTPRRAHPVAAARGPRADVRRGRPATRT